MSRCAWLALLLFGTPAAVSAAAPDADQATVLSRLAVERRDAARKTYEVVWANYREGRGSGELVYRWSKRWLKAERQRSGTPADQVAAFEGHYERMRALDQIVRRLHRAGQFRIDEVTATAYYRSEAEIWLLQARQRQRAAEEKRPAPAGR